ncbi:WD40 repeat-like protein [Dentipellis sp. KUC8613]|nr:WD40 repeat-like protein [Dentipellis sp. KUC8613]
MPAILDMKWCHTTQDRRPLLAIANAEGEVTLHEWDKNQRLLEQTGSIRCAPPDVLCLSLDWSNRRFPTSTMGSLVVSLSNGEVALLEPNPETGLQLTDTWHAHDFEPWIAAWDYWDPNVIFSGGDDLKLKIWDKRQGFDTPTTVNKRFDAGITTIQSHPHVEHIFAVGSYDSTVRLYDRRKPLTPLTEADVSGGAWRVKWHPAPNRNHDLLVACMHDSFKIIKFRDIWEPGQPKTASGQNWEIAQAFDKHESLGYGVDWSFSPLHGPEPGNTLIASASFYDHALHLWKG